MTTGADFAFSRPTPKALWDAGIRFVLRYYSQFLAKNLTRQEADGYAAQGIQIGTVYEDLALLDPSMAAKAGTLARTLALQCGQPLWAPIYVAADAAVQASGINSVLQSLQTFDLAAAPYVGGLYGDALVCAAGIWVKVKWLWQTVAWSNGKIDAGIGILQTAQSLNVGGSIIDIDIDEGVMAEHGLWTPGQAAPVLPETFGDGWWRKYGFADPPPGIISRPEIVQGKIIGEQW